MGNVLSWLDNGNASNVFIDFENAEPTNNELEIYNEVAEVLNKSEAVFKKIADYKDSSDLAKTAMQNPTKENETEFFEHLLEVVDNISLFYKYSKELGQCIPKLLKRLTADDDEKSTLADQQALAKQLADIFDFTLKFDSTRMSKPSLSNSLSYYRRLLQKFGNHPDLKIKDDEASSMALFTAEHIPMMTSLSKATSALVDSQEDVNVTDALASMANICMSMVKSGKFEKDETNLFCVRAMVGAMVLFDHVDPLGTFHKKSKIKTKMCLTTLKKFPKNQIKSLVAAVKYSTIHYKDDTTPSGIKDLLDN